MRNMFFTRLLPLICILLINTAVTAATPENYTITYIITDENQQVSEERCYVLNDSKMRLEFISEGDVSAVELYMKEQKVIYTLYPSSKYYSLDRLTEGTWDWAQRKAIVSKLGKKKRKTKFLGLLCDTYVKENKESSTTTLVSRDYDIILQIVEEVDGRVVKRILAKNFKLTVPDAALFRIPEGYMDAMAL